MRALFYIIILLIVTGCTCSGSVIERELDDASRLIQSDPTAALHKLNRYDLSEFADSATMARWALLYSEALVANNLSAPNDTIVGIAIDYYGNHNVADKFRHASRLKALLRATGNRDDLATALYLQKEKEFMLYKERGRRERALLVSLLILLAAGALIVWMRQRMKLQIARNETLMAEAYGLRCRLDIFSRDVDRLETTLHSLLESRFALIDSLCQTYYESQGTKTERKAIADKVKAEIEAMRSDSFPEMERAVNECRDNLLGRVRDAWPEIKPDDYRLLVYLASGLSTRSICLLTDESTDVIYKRKSRLKARLRSHIPTFGPDYEAVFKA